MAKEFDLSMVSAERHRHGIGKAECIRQNISVASYDVHFHGMK